MDWYADQLIADDDVTVSEQYGRDQLIVQIRAAVDKHSVLQKSADLASTACIAQIANRTRPV